MSSMLLTAAIAIAVLALLRLGFLVAFRQPIAARLIGHDYGAGERAYDRDMRTADRYDDHLTSADVPWRSAMSRVAYSVQDREYRTDVAQVVRKGDAPDATMLVWYDPSDPGDATGLGLGVTVALPLFVAVMLAIACFVLPG